MKDASEYLNHVRALIVLLSEVVQWRIIREEAQGDAGLFRYRLSLRDGGMLQMFELFRIVDGDVEVSKYSFHWQDKHNHLIKRWDNAAHHPEVSTHPNHVHDGDASNVVSHPPVDAETILGMVSEEVEDA